MHARYLRCALLVYRIMLLINVPFTECIQDPTKLALTGALEIGSQIFHMQQQKTKLSKHMTIGQAIMTR